MELISVILPARNRARLIGRQLEALARQDTDRPFEVIVADHGSTDDTVAVARSFADRFRNLDVVDAASARGGAGARNIAIAHAAGSVLALCDSDDVADPTWLDRLVGPLDAAPGLVAGRIVPVFADRPVPAPADRATGRPRPALLGFRPFADTCNLAIRADDFRRLGGFDDSYVGSEDVEFSWRAQLDGLAFVDAVDAVMIKYRRPTVGGRWRQRFDWGRAHARLYALYRDDGMARPPASSTLGRYAKMVARTALVWKPAQRELLMLTSAEAAGHLAGSLKWRVWYP